MNDILKAMKERRSIRRFKPDMPKKEDIRQIIEAGLYAPSGMGSQNTLILAVTDRDTRDRLSKANREAGKFPGDMDPFYGGPVVLVVLAKKDWPTKIYDGSLVMGNLLLAAHALGLGGIWIHRAKEEFELPEFKKILEDLGAEGEWEGIGNCVIGYIDGEAPEAAERKPGRALWVE